MTPRAIRLPLLAAAPLLTVVLCAAALVALNCGGEAKVGSLTLMRVSAGYSRLAEKLLASPAPSQRAVNRASDLSRKALQQFPYDNSSWLRVAYTESLETGRVTPEAVELLRRSYEIAGVDIYAGVWRISFILENSQDIPRDVRMSARNEFETLWRDNRRRQELQAMAVAVRNPAGRLSAGLWLSRAKASAAK